MIRRWLYELIVPAGALQLPRPYRGAEFRRGADYWPPVDQPVDVSAPTALR